MTAANFIPAVTKIKGYEGGFSDLAKDPGGATNFGITQAALAVHRGHPVSIADVRGLQWPEAEAIYHSTYWPAVQGDILPSGVDLILFDAAVNCGRGRAVTFLQAALGLEQDGDFGPQTMAKLKTSAPYTPVIDRIEIARSAYYRALPTFRTFRKGWMARLSDVTHTAIGWAA